jgi:hypothetical protein
MASSASILVFQYLCGVLLAKASGSPLYRGF